MTIRTESTYPPLGDQVVDTVRGPVMVVEVPGLSTALAERPGGETSIVMLAYDNDPSMCDGVGAGFIAQLSPDGARTIAASLCAIANQIDGGRKN